MLVNLSLISDFNFIIYDELATSVGTATCLRHYFKTLFLKLCIARLSHLIIFNLEKFRLLRLLASINSGRHNFEIPNFGF